MSLLLGPWYAKGYVQWECDGRSIIIAIITSDGM